MFNSIIKLIKRFQHIILKIRLKFASPTKRAKIMKNKFYRCGKNVELYTIDFGTEPYLISIHDNVVCAANVRFINHDISCYRLAKYINIPNSAIDSVGPIELFENSFIGAYTILMPGCSVGKNSVIAAGSIVTKQVPDEEVWGGVPAKFIMTTDDYAEKLVNKCKEYPWLKKHDKSTKLDIITERQKYFFSTKNIN